MYLLKADYKSRISTDLLNKIISEGASDGSDVLATVGKIAEDTISTLAGVLYDTAPELAKAGALRNYMLLSWALSIACYEAYQRIDDEQIPEKVIKNYNDAMADLEKVSQGKKVLNLPPKPVGEDEGGGGEGDTQTQGHGLRRIGYKEKRSHEV
jgi:hypothetical protein